MPLHPPIPPFVIPRSTNPDTTSVVSPAAAVDEAAWEHEATDVTRSHRDWDVDSSNREAAQQRKHDGDEEGGEEETTEVMEVVIHVYTSWMSNHLSLDAAHRPAGAGAGAAAGAGAGTWNKKEEEKKDAESDDAGQ